MDTILKLIMSLAITLLSLPVQSEDIHCSTLIDCEKEIIKQGEKRESDKYGMTKVDSKLAKEVRALNVDILPMLTNLLKSNSFGVRRLAAYTLIDIENIDEKYFPAIQSALDNTPWLVRGLGNIKTQASAKEAVHRYLISDSAPQNGEFYAVKELGELSVPYIIEALKCEAFCPRNYEYNFGALVSEMEVDKVNLVKQLSSLITDDELSDEVVSGAINVLSFMKFDAISAEQMLVKLLKDKPQLNNAIENALVKIGTDGGINILINSIAKSPSPYNILELVEKGKKANKATPVLIDLTAHENSEIRQVATRALGFVGDSTAEPALISLLSEPNNVSLVIVATQSLAMLKAEGA